MNRVVVKLGGHALDSLDPRSPVLLDLAQDVERLRAGGTDVVVVHGGGPQIAELLSNVGLESRFQDGLRITNTLTMSYVAMALSRVNLLISAALNQAGLICVGLSGADAKVFSATSLGEPWDRAAGTPKVRSDILTTLWASGVTPVVSSIAVDDDGQLINCNADAAAGALASALDASALVLLSDIDQLRSDPDDSTTGLTRATSERVRQLIDSGAAREGMRPKMLAALDALEGGAQRILMANGTRAHALRDVLNGTVPTTEVVR